MKSQEGAGEGRLVGHQEVETKLEGEQVGGYYESKQWYPNCLEYCSEGNLTWDRGSSCLEMAEGHHVLRLAGGGCVSDCWFSVLILKAEWLRTSRGFPGTMTIKIRFSLFAGDGRSGQISKQRQVTAKMGSMLEIYQRVAMWRLTRRETRADRVVFLEGSRRRPLESKEVSTRRTRRWIQWILKSWEAILLGDTGVLTSENQLVLASRIHTPFELESRWSPDWKHLGSARWNHTL